MGLHLRKMKHIDMKNLVNRYIVVIFLLIISSVLIQFLTYSKFNHSTNGLAQIKRIPLTISKWQGQDVPLEERIYEILETRSIVYRKYISENGEDVFLEIIYYPETKVDFHSPEDCLAGEGISVSKSRKTITIINDGKAFEIGLNQLVRKQMNKENLIYYFYKAGDFVGPSYIQLRFNLALNKFLSNKKSGALILVSTAMNDRNRADGSKVLKKFIQKLFPYIQHDL